MTFQKRLSGQICNDKQLSAWRAPNTVAIKLPIKYKLVVAYQHALGRILNRHHRMSSTRSSTASAAAITTISVSRWYRIPYFQPISVEISWVLFKPCNPFMCGRRASMRSGRQPQSRRTLHRCPGRKTTTGHGLTRGISRR
jgi:hypothetical protein